MILSTLRAVLGSIYARATGATPTIADAYLEDFFIVPAVGRFCRVDAVGRVCTVAAVGRWIVVPR